MVEISTKTLISRKVKKWTWPIVLLKGSVIVIAVLILQALLLHLRHNSLNYSLALPTPQLILQPFRSFTYVTDHYRTLFRFSYVTVFSLTSPGEPPMQTPEWYIIEAVWQNMIRVTKFFSKYIERQDQECTLTLLNLTQPMLSISAFCHLF